MADTIRQLIISNFISRLETILIANDYETDVGKNVFDWREYPVSMPELPCLIVEDTKEIVESDGYSHEHQLEVQIEICHNGSDILYDMRKMIGDIYKACGVDISFGGYCYMMDYEGDSIEVEHAKDILGNVICSFVLYYKTKAFDPFAIINV